jgi:hypothetical protein
LTKDYDILYIALQHITKDIKCLNSHSQHIQK